MTQQTDRARPVQVRDAEVVLAEPVGAYVRLVLAAPDVAAGARPGQFVAFAVGGPGSAMLLRRSFSIASADAPAGTVEVVVAAAGAGSRWLTERRMGDRIDVVGPLGAPFPLLSGRTVLVGGGYGAAPLAYLRSALPDAAAAVVISGAASAERLLEVEGAVVTTDDGSAGRRGRVTDALSDVLSAAHSDAHFDEHSDELAAGRVSAVYACGPMPMLAAVERVTSRAGVAAYLAVEEAMACGIGVCMTCVLPVSRPAGAPVRMLRSCVEGPVFAAGEVQFAAVGTLPA